MAAVILLVFSLFSFCGENSAKGSLVAAQNSGSTFRTQDRRKTIEEMLNSPIGHDFSEDDKDFFRALGETIVFVSTATQNGKLLNESYGSGFFFNGSQCYIVSARHNVNLVEEVVENGQKRMETVYLADPVGAKVEVRAGFGSGQRPKKLTGTVISSGEFTEGVNGDRVLIRLDAPFGSGTKLLMESLAPKAFEGRELIKAGFSWDMQVDINYPTVGIDPKCMGGKGNEDAGVTSTCQVAPGDSGGIAIDRHSKKVVGMWIYKDKSLHKTVLGTDGQARVLPAAPANGNFIGLSSFVRSFRSTIRQDQRRSATPCKEDLRFLED